MNVLLLDPPWRRRIFRDCFCTSIAKADYGWQPADLLAQSGQLAAAGMSPHVLDAVAEGLAPDRAASRAAESRPDAVFALTSPVSEAEDDAFLSRFGGLPLVVTGERAALDPRGYLGDHPAVDAVLTDFTSPALAAWLAGCRDPASLPGLTFRHRGAILDGPPPTHGPFDLPVPLHQAFPRDRYRMPALGRRFATLLTDFGCPHRCALCNSGALGHRVRRLDRIAEDVDHIRALGLDRVFVKSMSFGQPRDHARAVCDLLGRAGMTWTAYVRPDGLDRDLATTMARAGCRRVRMGIESGDSALRRAYGKVFTDQRIREAVRAARATGLEVGIHLVAGLPGEGLASLRATRVLLRALDPDDVSINLPVVRRGSADQRDGAPAAGMQPPWAPLARSALYLDAMARPGWIARTVRTAARDGELLDLLRDGLSLVRGLAKG